MWRWNPLLFLSCALVLSCRRSPPPPYLTTPPDYWPTGEWRMSAPEAQGVDSARLAELVRSVRAKRLGVHSLLVVRHGRVVLDASFFPFGPGELHDVASITKSVTATLIDIAVRERLLTDIRQPMQRILSPRWASVAGRPDVTIEQLLTMTSGVGCGVGPEGETAQTLAMERSPDWVQFALDAPTTGPPGKSFEYCNVNYHLLSAVIARAAGESALDFARRQLFETLGIRDAIWPADPQGINHGWGDLHLRPRDLAKIGLLYLHGGSWSGRRVLDPEWISRATRPQVRLPDGSGYGYGWWPGAGRFEGVYAARGRGGQLLAVSPALDVVVVLTGGGYRIEDIAEDLLAAIRKDGSLPQNPEAEESLRRAVEEVAAPPHASMTGPLPEIARRISGRTWSFDENPLRIYTLSLAFEDDRVASVRIDTASGALSFRVGLDGVPRLSRNGGRYGLAVAGVGAWRDGTLELDLDEVANINRFRMRAAWSGAGEAVDVSIEEATGLVPPHRIHGRERS